MSIKRNLQESSGNKNDADENLMNEFNEFPVQAYIPSVFFFKYYHYKSF